MIKYDTLWMGQKVQRYIQSYTHNIQSKTNNKWWIGLLYILFIVMGLFEYSIWKAKWLFAATNNFFPFYQNITISKSSPRKWNFLYLQKIKVHPPFDKTEFHKR